MAKPTITNGGREYGKRLYVSKMPYQKHMRQHTDAHKQWSSRVPHSEAKKPYLPDKSYQEMEYFDYPWDSPIWPGLPGIPDDTAINDDPEVNGYSGGNPPKDFNSQFLGCDFYIPLIPMVLSAGDVASAKLERRDDPIIGVSVQGPASVISGGDNSLCTADAQRKMALGQLPSSGPSSPECTVNIQVFDPINPKKWGTESGLGQIVLIANTASGRSCSTSAFFIVCTGDEDALEWDSGGSASTILQSSSAGISIIGGLGPYKWSVSGTGFSLGASETPVDGLSNTLIASGSACGTATISVKDTCGQTTMGVVRCTDSGQWTAIDAGCVAGGAADYSTWPNPWGHHHKFSGQYYCRSQYGLSDANFYGWELDGDEFVWVGCDGCDSRCQDCNPTGNGCEPCVSASVNGGGIYTGNIPCCYRFNKVRCACEQAYFCYEWTC